MTVTVLEVLGLLLVIAVGGWHAAQSPVAWMELVPSLDHSPWLGVFAGAFLAFFAFIGFEDMVNMAEAA